MSIILFARQVIYDPISITGGKKVGASAGSPKEISSNFQIMSLIIDYFGIGLLVVGLAFLFLADAAINESLLGLLVCICTFYLCATAAQGVYINLLNSCGDRKSAAIFSVADSVLKVGLVASFLLLFTSSLINILAGISISTFFVFLIMRRYIRRHYSFEKKPIIELKLLAKKSILISMPLYLPIIFVAFKSVSDRWLLTSFTGVDELAIYSVLLQIGYSPVMLFFGVVQTYFAPKIYQISADHSAKGRKELRQFIGKIFLSVFIFTFTAVIVSIFISKWLLSVLTGPAYHGLDVYMPIFVASGGLAALAGILQVVAIGALEVKSVGRLMYLSVLLSVGILLIALTGWGFIGAVAALPITGAVFVLLYWLRIYYELLPSRQLLSVK